MNHDCRIPVRGRRVRFVAAVVLGLVALVVLSAAAGLVDPFVGRWRQ